MTIASLALTVLCLYCVRLSWTILEESPDSIEDFLAALLLLLSSLMAIGCGVLFITSLGK